VAASLNGMGRLTLCIVGLSFMLVMSPAAAEVIAKDKTGFNLVITAEAQVSPMVAYTEFLNVGRWWLSSHTWFGDASALYIEPNVGGCFCEKKGENQNHHMLVTQIIPGKEVKMIGGLGPLQLMGLHGGMSWSFSAIQGGGTLITQIYNVTGYSPDGLDVLAPIVDSVQTQQTEALANYLNSLNTDE